MAKELGRKKYMSVKNPTIATNDNGPVAWHEPGAYGNVTTHKDWALANGWLPLYAAPREWLGQPDLARVGEVGVWGREKNT